MDGIQDSYSAYILGSGLGSPICGGGAGCMVLFWRGVYSTGCVVTMLCLR